MIRVGLIGLGSMGRGHERTLASLPNARVVAIADVDPAKLDPGADAGGNINAVSGAPSREGVALYRDAARLLADPNVDVADICLPTYLHAEWAERACEAGKHVIVEKPMARSPAEADRMIAAARAHRRHLFVAHCIRFWPAYARAADLVRGGEYGAVRTAAFYRRSALPIWSWQNWLQDEAKSGLCALDFHVHDVDFVQYLFGRPRAVSARSGGRSPGRIDHIVTTFHFDDDRFVFAEGGWEYASGHPFSMTFALHLERATLAFLDDRLVIRPVEGPETVVDLEPGDGYHHEMVHFMDCLERAEDSTIVTPESARDSLRLVDAAIRSARSNGREIAV